MLSNPSMIGFIDYSLVFLSLCQVTLIAVLLRSLPWPVCRFLSDRCIAGLASLRFSLWRILCCLRVSIGRGLSILFFISVSISNRMHVFQGKTTQYILHNIYHSHQMLPTIHHTLSSISLFLFLWYEELSILMASAS